MAIQQEEVKIKLGVDATQINAGLAGVQRTIGKFVDDTGKKLMSLAKANIYMMAIDLARQILPTAQEIWDNVYGSDPASMARFHEASERLHKLRRELESTRDKLRESLRDFFFDRADPRGKQEILFSEAQGAAATTQKAKAQLDYLKDHKAGIEEVAEAQKKYNEAFTEQLAAEKKLREFTDKMSPDDVEKQFEARRKKIADQVWKDRQSAAALRAFMEGDLARGNMESFRKNEADYNAAIGRIDQAVAANRAPALGDVSKTLGGIPFMQGAAKAFADAQQAVMADTIQRVSIVEVEE